MALEGGMPHTRPVRRVYTQTQIQTQTRTETQTQSKTQSKTQTCMHACMHTGKLGREKVVKSFLASVKRLSSHLPHR